MTYKTLIIERKNHVDYVTLNRPDKLNALNEEMTNELLDYFSGLEVKDVIRDESLEPRVVVLKGAGRGFCCGLDLSNNMAAFQKTGVEFFNMQRRLAQIIILMKRIKQPVISLVHGPAAGGGFALFLGAQIRMCTKDAKMNVAMAKIGLTGCDLGISYHLPRVVGPSVAAELMMTGKFLTADRAERLGAVSSVHDTKEELWQAGEEMANLMVETTPPLGLVMTKEGLLHSVDAPSLDAQIALEDRQQLLMIREPTLQEYIMKGFAKNKKTAKL